DNRLVEIGIVDAEGMTWDEEAPEHFPDAFPSLFTDPVAYIPPTNGEALPDMIARIDSFFQELVTKPHKKVFVLAHGYVLKVVYACFKDKSVAAIGESPLFGNCELAHYTYNGVNWELV
ncbi:MAG: histidine phosphatase family protein, partial [Defluviitaleaceae bacterium]|nr:histidine phosphatase family protein [Defluviitaleaceae bacterium]